MITLQILIGVVLLLWLYMAIAMRWRRGFVLLMIYLPFAGAVSLALHLWQPSLLFKDILFIVPIYVALAREAIVHKDLLAGFPRSIVCLMLCLAALALVQVMNTGVVNAMMAMIGLKVWLFYLPLSFAAYAYVESYPRFLGFWRLLVVLSFIPAGIAIGQIAMVQSLGYRAAMELSYGDIAVQATQRFTGSQFEVALFGRIPSIFTFPAQFFGFSLTMLVPAYIVWRTDSSNRWQRAGGAAFIAATLATFISGERASFVFTPLTIALIFLFDRGIAGFAEGVGVGILAVWAALTAVFGIVISEMYSLVGSLFTHYASDVAYGGLLQALKLAPLGMGTGTNTGAARYALADPDSFVGIENYYAKVVYELGLPGLLIVGGLFVAILVGGLKVRCAMRSPILRCWASALVAFFIVFQLNSFKGWQVDLDPVNVYYWVFCGLLFKLPVLQALELERWRDSAVAAYSIEYSARRRGLANV